MCTFCLSEFYSHNCPRFIAVIKHPDEKPLGVGVGGRSSFAVQFQGTVRCGRGHRDRRLKELVTSHPVESREK